MAMIARHQMTMRAVVERQQAIGRDEYGTVSPQVWQPHATLPCYAWAPAARTAAAEHQDKQRTLRTAELACAFPASADITDADRIARIEDRRAAVLWPGPMRIAAPLVRRRGHVVAQLERFT